MVTPAEAAEKFAREWLQAKPTAIANYAAVASTLAQAAINQKAALLTNFAAAVNNGSWERGLQKYVGNNRLENLYTEKLNSITAITDAEKLKIENSVELKQYLESQLAGVLAIFKAASSGERTVPAGLTDVGLRSMLMSGILSFEEQFTLSSTAQQIYDLVDDYMGSHYGWPNAA